MSMADELLADLGSGSEGEETHEENLQDALNTTLDLYNNKQQSRGAAQNSNGDSMQDGDEEDEDMDDDDDDGGGGSRFAGGDDDDDMEDEEQAKARVEKMQLGRVEDVRSVAGLMKILNPVLEKISHFQSQPIATKLVGTVEQNPEYHLLVESNAHSVSIDSEIMLVHKFIRDHYAPRFPELENLVTNPLDYARTVSVLGNQIKRVGEFESRLRSHLDGPTYMVVSVEAATSKGRDLSEKELATVVQACEMTLALDAAKHTITDYVSSRMSLFAPNTSALIGSNTAAQLVGFAGGITGLAKTPACNIPSLGAKARNSAMATNVSIRNQGFLFNSPIIRSIPNDMKRQAMRIVSAKVVLAARVDRVHEHPDGSLGEQLKEDVLGRLDKLTEPPPNKGPRALPAPDDKPSRKRGGRRARKAKEATAMTDLRKAQNRMQFGKAEEEVGFGTGEGTIGMGMIGQQDSGKIRGTKIDQRTRAKLSKNNLGWGTPAAGGASVINPFRNTPGSVTSFGSRGLASGLSGTASSLAFTPVQGIELVDPKVKQEMERKRKAEEDRWFQGGTFTQVGDAAAKSLEAANKKQDTGKGKSTGLMLPPALPVKKPT